MIPLLSPEGWASSGQIILLIKAADVADELFSIKILCDELVLAFRNSSVRRFAVRRHHELVNPRASVLRIWEHSVQTIIFRREKPGVE